MWFFSFEFKERIVDAIFWPAGHGWLMKEMSHLLCCLVGLGAGCQTRNYALEMSYHRPMDDESSGTEQLVLWPSMLVTKTCRQVRQPNGQSINNLVGGGQSINAWHQEKPIG